MKAQKKMTTILDMKPQELTHEMKASEKRIINEFHDERIKTLEERLEDQIVRYSSRS